MSDPLFPSRSTFTVDRIRAEWNEGRLRYRNRKKNYQSHIEIKYDANHNLTQMRRFCLALYAAVKDPVGHRERLDEVFARELLVAKIPDGWWDGDEEGVCACFQYYIYAISVRNGLGGYLGLCSR